MIWCANAKKKLEKNLLRNLNQRLVCSKTGALKQGYHMTILVGDGNMVQAG